MLPLLGVDVTEGAAGGVHTPTGVALTCDEFADSQVAMVLIDDTT
jgi:hypothetical protein